MTSNIIHLTEEQANQLTKNMTQEERGELVLGFSEKKTIKWSPQQQAFLAFCEDPRGGSCVLIAVAGAGKTTVLIEGGRRIPGGVAYMAYNRKIVDETKEKLRLLDVDWRKMQANTAHGFGVAAYRKHRQQLVVTEHKVSDILDAMFPRDSGGLEMFKPAMAKLVSLAKQHAFGIGRKIDDLNDWKLMADHYDVFGEEDPDVELPIEEIVEASIKALVRSTEMLDLIDFDDMIFMPLFHRVRFWQHDVVMIDEAQDTNRARRLLVRAMLRRGGRVIAVGDPHQAIYGFTGADADSLDLIAREFDCRRLNLTITFLCPKRVVEFSHRWVSHIQAADEAPDGVVESVSMESFFKRDDLVGGNAVLSRVTKPLVSMAFSLIRRRVPCRIEGRDVAASLKRLITRWKVTTLDALEIRLEKHLARETEKLLAKKNEAKLQQVEDAVDTIRVIIDQCRLEKMTTVADAVRYVDELFGDDVRDVLVLSSIHKSKGREWPTVFWLDRSGTCPSPWARQEWQLQQEKNLCYVAATRSMGKLIELSPPEKRNEK